MHDPGNDAAGDSDDLASVFDNVPDAIVVVDAQGRIARVNSVAASMFGYTAAELEGQPVEVLVPERFRAMHTVDSVDYLSRPRRRPMGAGLQLFAVRKDGSEFPVDISLSPFRETGDFAAVAVVRDMTERRRVEDALRHTEQELEEQRRHLAVLADRERIAMDLHDGVIQDLYSIGMTLQGVEYDAPDPGIKARVGQAVDSIDTVIEEIRTYIHQLRPGVLTSTDLRPALMLLAGELNELTGIATRTEIDPGAATRLAPHSEEIVRSVREAVSNVARHSGASEAVLRVTQDDAWLVVEIVDNGRGFEPVDQASGFGLRNLRKRLEPVGAVTEIESAPGLGTTVRFRFRTRH
ncbi:MAG: PAS domain S-box protein [Acidimicrobiia bacterium]|nr:PAS domain S-box protein [Acidimicrobiia bacterium]